MERFLKAKHWQIFLLQVGIPIVLYIAMLVASAITFISHPHDNEPPEALFRVLNLFFPLVMIISMGSLLAWQWSVGMGLQRLIPEHARMKTKLFKACIIVPAIYFGVVVVIVFIFMENLASNPGHFRPDPRYLFAALALIVPMHLFSIFSVFHNMVFVAKAIKTAELQRPVTFGDYGLEFVLNWFLFVGIWFLQPRINKLVNEPVKTEF